VNWLAHLEADNATNPNPVCIRWLLDGGFGDAANVTYLIEMGYDLYTIAHNGKVTQALRKEIPKGAQWTQVGAHTYALDMSRQQLGNCPYPVRLTLLRWSAGNTVKYSTLISFSETETLPLADLFPTYHQRQDVEAGIKQGKGTFKFTKLRVRSPAGIRLLGQFALFFWPNFVRWAADWLVQQVYDDTGRFTKILQQVRTQVRVAANTSADILTYPSGQLLVFCDDGPFPGVRLQLDDPFAYWFPMSLSQAEQQLKMGLSDFVKEQSSLTTTVPSSSSVAGILIVWPSTDLPENVPKLRVL
jgi:hypothetical protein